MPTRQAEQTAAAGRPWTPPRRRFFYGWVVVAVSFITMFLVIGTRFSLGIFYVAILEEYHWTRAETAGAFSLMLAVHAVFSLGVGVLFDRLGPRKLFPLGALAIALGFAACSQIRSIWQLYVFLGLLAAIGTSSLAFVPHMALVSTWFVRRRGMATGIAYSGIGGGMLILAPLIQLVIATYGWRMAFGLLALTIFSVVVPLTALFQRRRPQDLGLYADGLPPESAATGSGPATAVVAHDWTLREVLRTRHFWYLMATVAGMGMNLNTLSVHQMAHLTGVGYSKMLGATLTGLVGGMRSLGGTLLGSLSDRIGRAATYTLGSALAFAGVALLASIQDTGQPWRVYGFVVLYGLGYGALGPIYAAATADRFPGRSLGTILGVLEAGYGLGGAFGTYMAGYLYDHSGSYTISLYLVLGAIVGSCAALWGSTAGSARPARTS
ncbi:MAG: MFS transporter [Candidatus Tectimicrobiota bacterium]